MRSPALLLLYGRRPRLRTTSRLTTRTQPPKTATGLVFFAALVGNIIGWATGVLSDHLVVYLARRNGGVKEPEMRLWMLLPCFVYATLGYMLYGWGAQTGVH